MEVGIMKRHELTDEQWESIQALLPKHTAKTGRKRRDPKQMLNGILWILRTGAPWRDLPERFGPWKTVYHYFHRWRDDGTFDRILQALQIHLDRSGQIDWNLWCIDGSCVRASRASAGASKKVSNDTAMNPKTTLWAAQKADSAANSTWLLTAQEYPLLSK
jgi:transposase